jgi:hypothetical protein
MRIRDVPFLKDLGLNGKAHTDEMMWTLLGSGKGGVGKVDNSKVEKMKKEDALMSMSVQRMVGIEKRAEAGRRSRFRVWWREFLTATQLSGTSYAGDFLSTLNYKNMVEDAYLGMTWEELYVSYLCVWHTDPRLGAAASVFLQAMQKKQQDAFKEISRDDLLPETVDNNPTPSQAPCLHSTLISYLTDLTENGGDASKLEFAPLTDATPLLTNRRFTLSETGEWKDEIGKDVRDSHLVYALLLSKPERSDKKEVDNLIQALITVNNSLYNVASAVKDAQRTTSRTPVVSFSTVAALGSTALFSYLQLRTSTITQRNAFGMGMNTLSTLSPETLGYIATAASFVPLSTSGMLLNVGVSVVSSAASLALKSPALVVGAVASPQVRSFVSSAVGDATYAAFCEWVKNAGDATTLIYPEVSSYVSVGAAVVTLTGMLLYRWYTPSSSSDDLSNKIFVPTQQNVMAVCLEKLDDVQSDQIRAFVRQELALLMLLTRYGLDEANIGNKMSDVSELIHVARCGGLVEPKDNARTTYSIFDNDASTWASLLPSHRVPTEKVTSVEHYNTMVEYLNALSLVVPAVIAAGRGKTLNSGTGLTASERAHALYLTAYPFGNTHAGNDYAFANFYSDLVGDDGQSCFDNPGTVVGIARQIHTCDMLATRQEIVRYIHLTKKEIPVIVKQYKEVGLSV